MKGLPLKERRFFIFIYFLTIIFFVLSVYLGFIDIKIDNYLNVIFFIILTAITESFTVTYMDISFSTTFAITLASYILFGPFEATIIFIFGFLLRIVKLEDNYQITQNPKGFSFRVLSFQLLNNLFLYYDN